MDSGVTYHLPTLISVKSSGDVERDDLRTLQVQQGGITAGNLICVDRGRVPVHISAHQISKSNRVRGDNGGEWR